LPQSIFDFAKDIGIGFAVPPLFQCGGGFSPTGLSQRPGGVLAQQWLGIISQRLE